MLHPYQGNIQDTEDVGKLLPGSGDHFCSAGQLLYPAAGKNTVLSVYPTGEPNLAPHSKIIKPKNEKPPFLKCSPMITALCPDPSFLRGATPLTLAP